MSIPHPEEPGEPVPGEPVLVDDITDDDPAGNQTLQHLEPPEADIGDLTEQHLEVADDPEDRPDSPRDSASETIDSPVRRRG